MDTKLLFEILGYAASILIAVSLMMHSVLRLRIINFVGALLFTIYGLVIKSYPVAAVNFFIVLVNLYYLYQMRSAKDFFRLFQVPGSSEYLRYFLNHYRQDILRFNPGVTVDPQEKHLCFFVLRNMIPAGLVIGEVRNNESLFIELDYAIPGYRDFKMGRFVYFNQLNVLRDHGIQNIYARPGSPSHTQYLKRMGFKPEITDTGESLYRLQI